MANPHRGEVSFEAGGKTYVFKLGTHTLAAIEERAKMPFFKFFNRKPEEWGVRDMVIIFDCGLSEKYELTVKQVAGLMDELGHEKVGNIIAEAMNSAFGTEVATSNQNPPVVAKLHGIGSG